MLEIIVLPFGVNNQRVMITARTILAIKNPGIKHRRKKLNRALQEFVRAVDKELD